MRRTALTVLVMMLVAIAGCAGSSDQAMEDSGGESAAVDVAAPAEGGAAPAGDADGGADEAAQNREGGDQPSVEVPPATVVTSPGDRLIRDGTVQVRVEEDGFMTAFERVVSAARRLGGDMLSSDERTDDEGLMSGTVTVRVPAQEYDALLAAVADTGEVTRRNTTSEDVSTEFVDLESRLRHNEAQERFYLSLLEDAQGVEDAIAIQQRVEGIQQAIEEIEGRLRYLDERTSFSRLTVELFEAGAVVERGDGARPTFAHYLATAKDALVTVLGGALVVATVALPLGLFALLGMLLYRRFAQPLLHRPPVPSPATETVPAPPGPGV